MLWGGGDGLEDGLTGRDDLGREGRLGRQLVGWKQTCIGYLKWHTGIGGVLGRRVVAAVHFFMLTAPGYV